MLKALLCDLQAHCSHWKAGSPLPSALCVMGESSVSSSAVVSSVSVVSVWCLCACMDTSCALASVVRLHNMLDILASVSKIFPFLSLPFELLLCVH